MVCNRPLYQIFLKLTFFQTLLRAIFTTRTIVLLNVWTRFKILIDEARKSQLIELILLNQLIIAGI